MSGLWRHELRMFLRQRIALPMLLIVAVLASASVIAGLVEIDRQRDTIARIQPQQADDVAAIAKWVSVEGDAGSAAYYTMHATWDAPSPLAFAALGQRDVAPYVLRVRALGLEAQLYESENYNAELALPGRFDWAFVLTYIAPLIVIVLIHDLRSSEREAGRLLLLESVAHRSRGLWLRRTAWRLGLLFAALVAPFLIGAAISGADIASTLIIATLALTYLLFWTALAVLVARLRWSSLANAAALSASWLVLTLVLPTLAYLGTTAAIPVRQGVELTLAQRDQVHSGWDRPKDITMQAFFRAHPEWRETAPVTTGFHWKWYYAFQHVGDLSAAPQARAYRVGLEARERWTWRIGAVLPAVGLQAIVHRLAGTDLTGQLNYQDRIRAYHERLRSFYYPYIFNDTPFRAADFDHAPRWQ
jgi:ABC-2 type transport system permease protein